MSTASAVFSLASLVIGSLITMMSNSMAAAWLGLEVNTLAIIPLMIKPRHPRAVEATTKYFVVQAMASIIMLSATISSNYITGNWFTLWPSPDIVVPFTIALAIKLGMAPFHFWLPDVLQGLPMLTGLMLSTWQKLPPLTLFTQLSYSLDPRYLLVVGLASTIVGGLGGINQSQVRKILAYSSIANLGWVAAIVSLCPQLALFNFFIYMVLTSALFIMFFTLKALDMPKLMMSWANSPAIVTSAVLTFLSLAGLPPLTGFMPKLLITQEMADQNLVVIAMIMLMTTLLSLFFYLRMAYIMALTLSPTASYTTATWYEAPKSYSPILLVLSISLIVLLPLFPTLT
uniref:NADH-ubiquinone oxidoreductase chain 2 n=1 Tax=Craugastor pygmaeus TaxID=228437 RepID=Q53ED8_9NEOB|nr:NADH dehydrogenase subunit II [Craugastor pygmaeus]